MPNHTFPIGKLHPGKKYLGKRSKKTRKEEERKAKKEEARSTESKIPTSTMSKLSNEREKHILFIINLLQ